MAVEKRCSTCDALLFPSGDRDDEWVCPDCPDPEEVPW